MQHQVIFEETRETMFGPHTFKYIKGLHGAKINVPDNATITEIPYTLEYDTTEYSFGKKYNYPVDLPKIGLIVTQKCNGFGSGSCMPHIVRSVKHNKKGEITQFQMSPVYDFDEENKIAYCNTNSNYTIVQSKNKFGTWKQPGDNSNHLTYFISFGYISKPEASFDK